MKPCPQCTSQRLDIYRFTDIKEGCVKCNDCGYTFHFKAVHLKKIERLWNDCVSAKLNGGDE